MRARSRKGFSFPAAAAHPLPTHRTPSLSLLGGDVSHCGRVLPWDKRERKVNVEEPLSHPTFVSRVGFQHLGKERNKRKGACRQKGDVTFLGPAGASEPLCDRGKEKDFCLLPVFFPFVLCL